MLIAGAEPYFLNSYLSDDRAQFRATLTNADLGKKGQPDWLPRNSIRVNRGWVLDGAALYHRLSLHNYVRHSGRNRNRFLLRASISRMSSKYAVCAANVAAKC